MIKLCRHHYHNPHILLFCIYSEFDSKCHKIFANCAIPFLCVHFFSCTPCCVFCVADRCTIFRCTIVHGCGVIVQCRLGNDWYRLSILPSAMAYPALPLSVCCLFRRNNKFVTFSFSSFSPIAERMVDTAVSVALIASLGLGILMYDDTKERQYGKSAIF